MYRIMEFYEKQICFGDRRKQEIIKELLCTERSFLSHLDFIIEVFEKPLRNKGIIDKRKLDIIFNSVYTIKTINTALYDSLVDNYFNIYDSFLQFAPYLKTYSIYATNFSNAQTLLINERESNKEFNNFIVEQERLSKLNGLKLAQLLITPIQRLPRYKLLLEQLLELTKFYEYDYTKLKQLVGLINNVAEHMNEAIREHENFETLLKIQKRLCSKTAPKLLQTPFKRFIKEGKLFKVTSKGKSNERILHLFSDMLMCSKAQISIGNNEEKLYCYLVLPIQHCYAEIIFGQLSTDTGALFRVKCLDEILLFYLNNSIDVHSWVREINTARELYINNLKTLRKDNSKKRTMHKKSLIKHARLIHKQEAKLINRRHKLSNATVDTQEGSDLVSSKSQSKDSSSTSSCSVQ